MQSIPSLNELPPDAVIPLSNWSIVQISGQERHSFTQGQITINVDTLTSDTARYCAQCDPKGKMTGLGHCLEVNDNIWFIQHQDSAASSLAQFKKYGVFAKADIDLCTGWYGFGFWGVNAAQQAKACDVSYPMPGVDKLYIGWHPQPLDFSQSTPPLLESNVVDALCVRAGIPQLTEGMMAQWVPQMVNLQALNGIDYDKGCYLGQETIARTHYLGKNKRKMAVFTMAGANADGVKIGDSIERQIDAHWRKTGSIFGMVNLGSESWISAIVPIDLTSETVTRLAESRELTVHSLPYVIETPQSNLKKRN